MGEANCSGGVRAGPVLLEDGGDDLVQRRAVHAYVGDRVAGRQGPEHLAPPPPIHLQIHLRPVRARDLAEPPRPVGLWPSANSSRISFVAPKRTERPSRSPS